MRAVFASFTSLPVTMCMALAVCCFAGTSLAQPAQMALKERSARDRLAAACVAEGENAKECACYASFIKDRATDRQMTALATLAEPQNRDSLEKAVTALMAAGLTPGEIFEIGLQVESLQEAAEADCQQR